MRKVAVTLMFSLLALIMCVMIAHGEPELYAKVGIIIELNEEEDTVYFVDFMEQVWCFKGCEDWAIGDVVAAIMDTMGTEVIYDDEIVSVTYNGWIPMF